MSTPSFTISLLCVNAGQKNLRVTSPNPVAGTTKMAGIQVEVGFPSTFHPFGPDAVPAGLTIGVSILARFDLVVTNSANPNDGRSVSVVDMGDDANGCNIAGTGQ